MSLTREEQQQLERIEVRLSVEAPELERLLAPQAVAVRLHAQEIRRRMVRTAVFGLAAVAMLIVGICIDMVGLAVAGAAVMAVLPALLRLRVPARRRGSWSGR